MRKILMILKLNKKIKNLILKFKILSLKELQFQDCWEI